MGYLLLIFVVAWLVDSLWKPKLDNNVDGKSVIWYNAEPNNPQTKRKYVVLCKKNT